MLEKTKQTTTPTYDDFMKFVEEMTEIAVINNQWDFEEALELHCGCLLYAVPYYQVMAHLYDSKEYELLTSFICTFVTALLDHEPNELTVISVSKVAKEPFCRFFLESFERMLEKDLSCIGGLEANLC